VVKVTATVTVLVAVVDGGAAPTAWRPFSESNTQNKTLSHTLFSFSL
jgi:hypothetical protein